MVTVVFKKNFLKKCFEIIYILKKIIFDISTSKQFKNIYKNNLKQKKIKKIINFFSQILLKRKNKQVLKLPA
jgi:hypothetical protein